MDYVLRLLDKVELPPNIRAAIPWLLWGVWKTRNSALYADKLNDHHILNAIALEEMDEWTLQNQIISQEFNAEMWRSIVRDFRWIRPTPGRLKCNIHSSWINDYFHCGGAWILRDHTSSVLFHARDTFLPSLNRISAELQCVLWCLQSLHELRFDSCELWSLQCSNGSSYETFRVAEIPFSA